MADVFHWKQAKPGMVAVHRGGGVAILKHRKEDDSGWWLLEGGGLSDRVATEGDWLLLDRSVVRRLFEHAPKPPDGESPSLSYERLVEVIRDEVGAHPVDAEGLASRLILEGM